MATEDRDFKACLARAKAARPPDACPVCREVAWWWSVRGVRVCGKCHPAPDPKLVKERPHDHVGNSKTEAKSDPVCPRCSRPGAPVRLHKQGHAGWRCPVCLLLFLNPVPTAEELPEAGRRMPRGAPWRSW